MQEDSQVFEARSSKSFARSGGDSKELHCDLLVVGAGINGAGIARDAAGRGLSVVLCDKDDLAAHTSSASTKLVHGGLRYLEHAEFSLVRKALIEREVLLRAAPHIIWPLRFVMPHDPEQRPAWMIRAGLFLYDLLARRRLLPGSGGIDLAKHPTGAALQSRFKRGFSYSDCWVDDARLVVLNAIDAAEKGATVLTRMQCESLQQYEGQWRAQLRARDGGSAEIHARCVVNATGPWASQFLGQATSRGAQHCLRLVKGSHIVVHQLFDHRYAYIFQHTDRRIVFAIPYEGAFTLIGTTDLEYTGDLNHVAASSDEVDYLCGLANHYFKHAITPKDVVWSYSGVRPLLQDDSTEVSAITRDYTLAFDCDAAPFLTVFGGKITTFRKLAEEAVDLIARQLGTAGHGNANGRASGWTAGACLPGGDLFGSEPSDRSVRQFDEFISELTKQYAFLPPALIARYARAYGTRIHVLLAQCQALPDMGVELGPGLYAVEVLYLMRHEWACTAADILWRRSKLGLHSPSATEGMLDEWMARTVSISSD
ncbi:MAG: glycerol-3-phosphate dehydrogenase [Pseudomonadota bacterium]